MPENLSPKIIKKYLKVVRLAAESTEEGERTAAKEAAKKLIDKYPDLPYRAAAHAAQEYARGRAEAAQEVAQAAGAKLTPGTSMSGLMEALIGRTADVLGQAAMREMDSAVTSLFSSMDDLLEPDSPLEGFLPDNEYLRRGSITSHLNDLVEQLDADDNQISIEVDEEAEEEFLRVELSLPLELVEAIVTRERFKAEFVDWLVEGLFEDDSAEEDEEAA